jgi:hypothetical protein
MSADDFVVLGATGTPEQIQAAIDAGADVNARDMEGWTALMCAAQSNEDPEVISVLAEAGAEIDAPDNDGRTPLMYAAQGNANPEMVSALLKAGADINAKDNDGRTALDLAGENVNPEIAAVLKKAANTETPATDEEAPGAGTDEDAEDAEETAGADEDAPAAGAKDELDAEADAADRPNAPDAWVSGLWLKPTGLPEDTGCEDFSDGDAENPWIVYYYGKGLVDGPAVTVAAGRSPQSAAQLKKFLALDKTVLRGIVGSAAFWKGPDAKKLGFVDAPKFTEKFGYPCQLLTLVDSEAGESCMQLFIQTDEYRLTAQVRWETAGKVLRKAGAQAILEGVELVEQEGTTEQAETPSKAKPETQFKQYVDKTFGFSMEYPDIYDSIEGPALNKSGFSIFNASSSDNADCAIEIECGKRPKGATGDILLKFATNTTPDKNGNVSGEQAIEGTAKSGPDFYTYDYISGMEQITHFYCLMSKTGVVAYSIRYPEADAEEYEAIIARMDKSIRLK